jgi:hypothetical protein
VLPGCPFAGSPAASSPEDWAGLVLILLLLLGAVLLPWG